MVYDLLFKAAAETLQTIAADPKRLGARLGLIAVLHTWGSALTHHPHVHCIVPGGGLSPDGQRWITCRKGFFLPVRVLSRFFRRLFLEKLADAHARGRLSFFGELTALAAPEAFAAYLAPLRRAEWVVYAKPPFGGPATVLAYLTRCTYRVAISRNRLVSLDDQAVQFRWKDYRRADPAIGAVKMATMALSPAEFIRRFLIHVLPSGFHRIRHYGLLAKGPNTVSLETLRSASTLAPSCRRRPWRFILPRGQHVGCLMVSVAAAEISSTTVSTAATTAIAIACHAQDADRSFLP